MSANGSPGRTDDGRVVRDFKLDILLFSIGSFFSLSNFPGFSPDLAGAYGTFKYPGGCYNNDNYKDLKETIYYYTFSKRQ